jgi:alkylation response protein AidB-like acyl-CoA dehydrogenase
VSSSIISDELLVRCHVRAERTARPGDVLEADLSELRAAGFFRLAITGADRIGGTTLAQICQEIRRLAYYAPHAADALVMHFAWTGAASERLSTGDRSLAWLVEEAERDVLVGSAFAEPGNDAPLLHAGTCAERVDGGYRLTGQKRRLSAPGAWGYLALHGTIRRPGDQPELVFALLPRQTEGFVLRERQETAHGPDGAGADLLLDGTFVTDHHAVRVVPARDVTTDPLMGTLVGWLLLLQASVASARARRAFDLTVDAVHRTPVPGSARALAQEPSVQEQLARMAMSLEVMEPVVDRLVRTTPRGRRAGARWTVQLLTAHATAHATAIAVIDQSAELLACTPHARRAGLDALREGVRQASLHTVSAAAARRMIGRGLVDVPNA